MQYNLRKLQRELRLLIKKHYDAGTPELIKNEIQKLLSKYKGISKTEAEKQRKIIEIDFKKEFVKSKSATNKSIDKMLGTHYAVVQGDVNSTLVKVVQRGISSGMTIKQMTELIDRKLEMGKHKANTVARTARVAQNRAQVLKKGIAAGAKYFKYAGPAPERSFCSKHHNKRYTIKEILQLDNGQGLPALVYMGGYNCKHYWQAVFD